MSRAIVFFFILLIFVCAVRREKPELTAYTFPSLRFFPKMPVNEKNPVSKEGAELGRFLFYDPVLSADKTISCAGCHKQQFAFADTVAYSKGITGKEMKRNTLPLFNLAWSRSMFWDGRAAGIEEQVFHPVREHDEMNLQWKEVERRLNKDAFYRKLFRKVFGGKRIDSTMVAYAMAQFERTLISYRSKYDLAINNKTLFTPDERAGFEMANDMTKGDCMHCHTTDGDALGTTFNFSDNGLDDVRNADDYKDRGRGAFTGNKNDNGKFKIPSLRNVALTAPYMHDGRFKTLEEVVDFYSEGVHMSANVDSKIASAKKGGLKLSCEQKKQLVAFLKTLTDSAFVSDTTFSDPFKQRKIQR